jgi:hypothetical protein
LTNAAATPQGYGGLRARADRLDWIPVLPPHIKTASFKRFSYSGFVYSLEYTADKLTVELHPAEQDGPEDEEAVAAKPDNNNKGVLSLCTPVGATSGAGCKPLAVGVPLSLARAGFSLVVTAGEQRDGQ